MLALTGVVPRMGHTEGVKRLRLRWSDRCATCDKELAAGTEALWHRGPRVVTCLGCVLESPRAQEPDLESVVLEEAVLEPPLLADAEPQPPPVDVGTAGASALREYERRRKKREDHARQTLGVIGVGLAKLIDEPQSTSAWERGGKAEVYAGRRLERHLAGSGVKLLHDRRVPGHGAANIDHVAVGPGGVTVIDSKKYNGKVRVERVGGLFSPRRDVLKINGRDQTKLVSGVEKQVQYVLSSLRTADYDGVDVRGALCMTEVDGLPLIRSLSVRGVLVDGPKRAAALAKRPGELAPETVDKIWRHLAANFPSA
ncbi:MAG TPA: nuclease-related domain-containing protein [Solirubrobacteraceae bacterium]|nr:nuclease-related domain-containing protein [Solirubrobacteraceae bacterium]